MGPPPRKSNPKRTKPYTAVFSITPDIKAETGLGAIGCALGSHKCSGTIPALVPNPANASKKTAVRSSGDIKAALARICAKLLACGRNNRKAPMTAAAPACIMTRRLFRQFDRGQCLEDRKQRSAEQTNLLSRNRRQRASLKPLNVSQRLRRSSPSAILPLKNFANLGATRGVVINALGFFLNPLGKNRRPRIHPANGRGVGKIIKEETSGMRNLRELQTLRLHRQLSAYRHIVAIRICSQVLRTRRAGVFRVRSKVALPRQPAPNSTTSDDAEALRLQRVGGIRGGDTNGKIMMQLWLLVQSAAAG